MKLFSYLQKTSNLWLFGSFLFITYGASIQRQPTAGIIDHFKVGDVVYSLLAPTEFIKLHGSGWRFMNGEESKDVDNSDLKKFYSTQLINGKSLPDARGMFVRGMNADGGADPESGRKVGSIQSDDFKSHSHVMGRLWEGNGTASRGNELTQSTASTLKSGPTELTGGIETRPRNIALFVYVKVNEQIN